MRKKCEPRILYVNKNHYAKGADFDPHTESRSSTPIHKRAVKNLQGGWAGEVHAFNHSTGR